MQRPGSPCRQASVQRRQQLLRHETVRRELQRNPDGAAAIHTQVHAIASGVLQAGMTAQQ